ncbi:hypothetical protein TWF481_002751 [Arthrobotrys musiformis]|uniref:Uncharacterized protein n=1 Tax=Arthrobotrys musiformis TaxID=47236 RepID=A0AAV9VT98_9PEZI
MSTAKNQQKEETKFMDTENLEDASDNWTSIAANLLVYISRTEWAKGNSQSSNTTRRTNCEEVVKEKCLNNRSKRRGPIPKWVRDEPDKENFYRGFQQWSNT